MEQITLPYVDYILYSAQKVIYFKKDSLLIVLEKYCQHAFVILRFLLYCVLQQKKQEELQKKLLEDEEEPQTLQQQENMSIKGQSARHLVMQKLMRKVEVRRFLCVDEFLYRFSLAKSAYFMSISVGGKYSEILTYGIFCRVKL